jgi:hypothetical protein
MMSKKKYYKKKKGDCPCCGWQGHPRFVGLRRWLGIKREGFREFLDERWDV